MKKLDHETGKTFECARYSNSRADFDENSSGGVDVYLQFAGFVDR